MVESSSSFCCDCSEAWLNHVLPEFMLNIIQFSSRYAKLYSKRSLFRLIELARRLNDAPMPVFSLNVSDGEVVGTGE